MQHLPWLVIHGELVWQTLFGLSMAMTLAWVYVGRPWRVRRRNRARLAALGKAETAVHGFADGATVVIEGILQAKGQPCTRIEDGGPAAALTVDYAVRQVEHTATARAERLVIALEDHREVELVGRVRVTGGSREYHPLRSLHGGQHQRLVALLAPPAEAEPGAGPDAWPCARQVRSLVSGDRVRAVGRLRAAPASGHGQGETHGETSYREPASQWLLWADEEVQLAAVARPRVVALPLRHAVPRMLVVTTVLFALLSVLGGLARDAAWGSDYCIEAPAENSEISQFRPSGSAVVERAAIERRARAAQLALADDVPAHPLPEHPPIEPFEPLVLAAATPFHRAAAIDILERRLAWPYLPFPARAQAHMALADLDRGDCLGRARSRSLHGDHWQAIALARACRVQDRETLLFLGDSFLALGELARASKAYEAAEARRMAPAYPAVHMMARRWALASSILGRIADNARDGQEAARIACLAHAAAAQGGDPMATARLRRARSGPASSLCTLALAEVADVGERVPLLAGPGPLLAISQEEGAPVLVELRALLLAEVAPDQLAPDDLTWLRDERHDLDASRLVMDAASVLPSVTEQAGLAYLVPGQALRPAGRPTFEPLRALRRLGLQRAVLEQLAGEPELAAHVRELRAYLAANVATAEILVDRSSEARRWADLAVADLEAVVAAGSAIDPLLTGRAESAAAKRDEARLLQAAIALRAGDAQGARALLARIPAHVQGAQQLAAALALRLDGKVLALWPDTSWEFPRDRDVIARAAQGDGSEVVDALYPVLCHWPLHLGAVGPRIRQGKERIAESLRWCPEDMKSLLPADRLLLAGHRMWIARTLGDHAAANQEQVVAAQLHDVLSQRDSSVLVALLAAMLGADL